MTKSRYPLPPAGKAPSKPLIFGESAYDTDRLDDLEYANRHWDAAYVPGYSEQRVENEQRVKDGKSPIPMPRLQWVRVKRPNAAEYVSETDEAMIEWSRLGYKAMGRADLERYGYGWPPAAGSGPGSDGLICRGGDLALFFIDEDRADRNRIRRNSQLRDEKDFIPDSKTGEVVPIEEERFDEEGQLFFDENSNIPNL